MAKVMAAAVAVMRGVGTSVPFDRRVGLRNVEDGEHAGRHGDRHNAVSVGNLVAHAVANYGLEAVFVERPAHAGDAHAVALRSDRE